MHGKLECQVEKQKWAGSLRLRENGRGEETQ
jgi:hypothetical protein